MKFGQQQHWQPLLVILTVVTCWCLLVDGVTAGGGGSVVTMNWPEPTSSPLNVTMGYGTVTSTGTRFSWYTAVLDDLSRFSIHLPATCNVRKGTTYTADAHKCVVATNAGYFQFLPSPTNCLGEIVIDKTIELWQDDGKPLFGVTADKKSFVGVISKEDVSSMDVTYAVSGFGVIVQNGTMHGPGIATAARAIRQLHPNAEEVAPRTVIALDQRGRIVLTAIDGVEKMLLGLTLNETSEIFAGVTSGFPFGGQIAHAINMDGGGSTTFVKRPHGISSGVSIYNRPTSTDVGDIVEREVTSIACITG